MRKSNVFFLNLFLNLFFLPCCKQLKHTGPHWRLKTDQGQKILGTLHRLPPGDREREIKH